MIKEENKIFINVSPLKFSKLFLKREKPALEKADMEWKRELNPSRKMKNNKMAPIICKKKELITMNFIVFLASEIYSSSKIVFKPTAVLIPIPLLKNKKTKAAPVIIPKAPNWIKNKITILPKRVKSEPVSKTIKPVTVVAEVAVKRASKNVMPRGVAQGNFSKIVPIKMVIKKPSKRLVTGFSTKN